MDSDPERPRKVVFSAEQTARLRRAQVAHNHLSESFLSLADVVLSVRWDIAANWVTTPGGTRFGLILGADHGITEEAITNAYDRAILTAYAEGTETTDYEARLAEAFRDILNREHGG